MLTKFAAIVTILYSLFLVWLRWPFSLSTLQAIPINELGDFFAGVFGPLMLFWVIIGYIQQQKELKQNTEALLLQAKELKNSVEHQAQVASATQLQAETDIKVFELQKEKLLQEDKPNFAFIDAKHHSTSRDLSHWKIDFINNGPPCTDIRLTSNTENVEILKSDPQSYLDTKAIFSKMWAQSAQTKALDNVGLTIKCLNVANKKFEQSFDLKLINKNTYQLDRG